MKYVILNDIAQIYLGLTHTPKYVSEGIPFLSVKDISQGRIDFENCKYITAEEYNKLPIGAKPQANDILFCRVGTLGKPIVISPTTPKFGSFVSLGFLRVKNTNIELDYLKYWMQSKMFFSQVYSNVSGAAQVNLNTGWLKNFLIPFYEKDKQKSIINELNSVNNIITLAKQRLLALDALVKSRFIEMFGDQETNPYNLNVGKLSDVADIYLGLTHTPTYVEQGKPFLSVRDISSGVIDFSNCHYITEEEFDSLPNGARPKVGDMLFCRVGTIGKPVIIPENTPEFGTFVSVGYLRKKVNVNNYYLKSWMENDYFMRQVYDNVAGASQINLNTGWLKNFRILIPPMALQEQFAAFVEQTDKSKFEIQKSLEKLETLKEALMQKYFG